MKTPRWLAPLVLGLTLLAPVARAALELSAFMSVGGRPRLVLTDLDARATSDWITLGQTFRGYQLIHYDDAREMLAVRKDGRVLELPLKGSHVAMASSLPPEVVARGITADDLIVRDSGPVRITLSVGATQTPFPRRFVDVTFDNGAGRSGVEFGGEGPKAIARSFVPSAVRDSITDADIAAINAHLASVLPKWIPDHAP